MCQRFHLLLIVLRLTSADNGSRAACPGQSGGWVVWGIANDPLLELAIPSPPHCHLVAGLFLTQNRRRARRQCIMGGLSGGASFDVYLPMNDLPAGKNQTSIHAALPGLCTIRPAGTSAWRQGGGARGVGGAIESINRAPQVCLHQPLPRDHAAMLSTAACQPLCRTWQGNGEGVVVVW